MKDTGRVEVVSEKKRDAGTRVGERRRDSSFASIHWAAGMRRANVEEGWREGAPARARVDGSTVVVDAAAMGRPRAFEDGRAWDHRDEARARGVYAVSYTHLRAHET